ncbi:hypothetical protein MGYG_00843 [Nannizzia gypsea CBS 118893]|uniref:Pleckstrin homology domain-containing protein n=1 Tax=Arthroderma gypseum (strain ATCC MYA-4604 / CBS 118893) TaxID=535722 RepID=E5R224_ARTGP|nr:hypothetical protein MGYG_00843 [Nannizzia gypsea CBS 118893]EFQ97803.1 hypothetical protein MGYG_00843 [Nannizzia gypsea CBS 118893]
MREMPGQASMDSRDSEGVYTSHALTDTPYQALVSRQSLSWIDSPPKPSSLRLDLADGHESRGKLDAASEDSISPLDPRRFTPTLHASLVSEILSLRRDLEGKSSAIESLELSLEASRSDEESLKESLAIHAKENRTLKKQIQLLEGGSLSAVTELTKERDDAWESIAESRRRLEDAQRNARLYQDQAERTQELWDADRQRWDDDKRKLETKVHIVEGRLKTVINEITISSQAADWRHSGAHNHLNGQMEERDVDMVDSTTPRAMDAMSLRSNSPVARRRGSNSSVSTYNSYNHLRNSVTGLTNGTSMVSTSLADELAFEDIDDGDLERPDSNCRTFSRAETEPRPMSSQSILSGQKARKILGLAFDTSSAQSSPIRDHFANPASPRFSNYREVPESPSVPKSSYRDVGIQFTPPPSPLRDATMVNGIHRPFTPPLLLEAPITPPAADDLVAVTEKTARVYETLDTGVQTHPAVVTSTECQTIEDFPDTQPQPEVVDEQQDQDAMVSSSTQTEEEQEPTKELSPETPEFSIPMIAIHPPLSNPATPRSSVVLPPQTKSACCQTLPEPQSEMRSSGVQTDEIREVKRPARLPFDLLPSAFPDQSVEPTPDGMRPPVVYQPYRPPPANTPTTTPRLREAPPVDVPISLYPGNNDNGPLSGDMQGDIRRPFRSSSLFAGFDHESDDDASRMPVEEVFNDDESILSRPMASYTIKMGKLVSKPSCCSILDESPMEIHEDEESTAAQATGDAKFASGSLRRSSATRGKISTGTSSRISKRQGPSRQRAASGSTAADSRPKSPNASNINTTNAGSRPPFPVPTRFSSRKVPSSMNEDAQSPTPNGCGSSISDHSIMGRDSTLRKIRSAAAVSRPHYRDDNTNSLRSPTSTLTSAGRESPQFSHRLPQALDPTSISSKAPSFSDSRRPSRGGESYHERKASSAVSVSVQQTSVVDAIAQTMVGEWMYKYVRRRKSFGMTEAPKDKDGAEGGKTAEEASSNISGNGVRHKRWVWLAPYERAVMWSSKQPTTGTALLGKSGRKLIIQSVLDVKDDNPLPRGASPQNSFNRSILILTPQRALKFTALTLDRHYVWLTALSFLSHSSLGLDDLATLPPVPQVESGPRPLTAALRRNPIRDSIRVAKGKTRPMPNKARTGAPAQATVPEEVFPEMPGRSGSNGDCAAPPNVPRFAVHSRKRSNTAPKPMSNPFRSFSGNTAAASTYSSGSSDLVSPTSVAHPGVHSGQSSHRTSEASGHPPPGMANFFDAVGTMRMEAFVDKSDMPRQRGYRGRKKDHWPQSPDLEFRESDGGGNDFFRNYNPYREY